MPLHPHYESPINILNRFDHTVGSSGNGPKVRSNAPDGLVMKAVYFNNFRTCQPCEYAALTEANGVPRRFSGLSMVVVEQRGGDVGRDVLNQSATTEDVKTLS